MSIAVDRAVDKMEEEGEALLPSQTEEGIDCEALEGGGESDSDEKSTEPSSKDVTDKEGAKEIALFALGTVYMLAWTTSYIVSRWALLKEPSLKSASPAIVLTVEFIKLIVCTIRLRMLLPQDEKGNMSALVRENFSWSYGAPALIYSVYNTIVYINTQMQTPSIYQFVMHFRTIFTVGFAWLLFRRLPSLVQTVGLTVCAAGVMNQVYLDTKAQEGQEDSEDEGDNGNKTTFLALMFMFLQAALNGAGGSVTEYLYKTNSFPKIASSPEKSAMLGNLYMYTFGIGIALVPVVFVSPVSSSFFLHFKLVLLIATFNSAAGISTSFVLAMATNEAKCVFTFMESFVTICASALLLGDKPALGWHIILGNLLVVLSGSFCFLFPQQAVKVAQSIIFCSRKEKNSM